jgi:hypothetical protein
MLRRQLGPRTLTNHSQNGTNKDIKRGHTGRIPRWTVAFGASAIVMYIVWLYSPASILKLSSDNINTSYPSSLSIQSTSMRQSSSSSQCTVWMAPSSLKGLHGFGVFTTRPIALGEKVLNGPDGVSIPVEAYRQ